MPPVPAALREELERRARIPARVAFLLEAERWDPERRARWVRARLAEQVEALRATAYGREVLGADGAWDELPVLGRATLRERFEDLRAADPGPVAERRTSGSTGRPVRALHGPDTIGHAAAARLRQLAWFGLEPGPHPQLNMRIAAAAGEPALARDPGDPPLWWLSPYALDARTVREVHDELVAAGGVRLAGAESSLLARWAELVEAAGLDGRELGLRLIVAGGEMTYPEQRAAGERVFGCAVAELYGSHELSILAAECPRGSVHVAEEAVHVEILRPDGAPAAAGERGEVVVSLLHNTPMPILRYRLGDTAVRIDEPCACGRTLARLAIEIGRLEEMVRAPDGRLVHPRFLRSLYERAFGDRLRAFHTRQVAPGEFVLRVELDGPLEPGAAGRLEADIAGYLGGSVRLTIEPGHVEHPPGKLRTFTALR